MEEVEHVAAGGLATRRRESGDIRIGTGERGCAQIEARREKLDHAADDSLRVAGLDLALDRHRKPPELPLGGEHGGDGAEGNPLLVRPAIRRDVATPTPLGMALLAPP